MGEGMRAHRAGGGSQESEKKKEELGKGRTFCFDPIQLCQGKGWKSFP